MRSVEDEEEEGTPKDSSSSTSAEGRQLGASEMQMPAHQTSASAAATDAHINGSSQRSGSQSANTEHREPAHQADTLVQFRLVMAITPSGSL